METRLHVLLYWPNVIGYIRIGLVFAAWAAYETPAAFVPLYSVFIALDEVDGWLARRLGQSSRFGAWLDVVVDNLGRGMLWGLLFEWGWLVSAVEWCVFVCNHNQRGDNWKNSFTRSPRFIQVIMANGNILPLQINVQIRSNPRLCEFICIYVLLGFRTPLGTWVVSGLHCLPLWLYGYQWGFLSHWLYLPLWIQALGAVLLAAGRLLALSAEIWCIWTHIEYLTNDEPEEKNN